MTRAALGRFERAGTLSKVHYDVKLHCYFVSHYGLALALLLHSFFLGWDFAWETVGYNA